ncbi:MULTISPECIES: class II aldolase/adducin family protein [Pseudomonas]|uniref:class II aldolase/adducin family protein n=1 Tax=Pseudomonas TaxID=286 RepID=UPI0015C1565C|nr:MULTISPECIES: class II aldolase/adducin family protein [Pseudomonas]MDH4846227.1 class II aldolase/adducin family protein [Pseudomonas sp. BN605]MDH4858516.1 class II aldolase/adducin family protein [Pseudomonas sp. BN505]NWL08004.1 class II aldolase [Pseudomonas hunanensis]
MSTAHYFNRPLKYSELEWQARVKLAACYRIFDYLGWSESIYNHISLRVPGPDAHFLINPFGLHYSEVRASNLIKVDVNGALVEASDWPINPAGFTFHGAIHQHVPTGHCVMHMHTTPTLAVCSLEGGLSYSNFYAAMLHGRVAYHEFEGITVHADEGLRIVQSAGHKPILLLKNHGPVVIGHTLAEAFSLMWLVQRACEVQLATMSMGIPINIPQPVLESCVRENLSIHPKYGAGEDVFAAMTRLIDRVDISYRY